MAEEPTAEPWPDLTIEFELREVRLVATFGHDGGAIVENVRSLKCVEGRLFAYESNDGSELHTLQYVFRFGELADGDPMASSSSQARIVITGRHRNGHAMEIRGDGWFGYDEKGNVEGIFDIPPVIITEDPDIIEIEDDDIEPTGSMFDFPMPPQYNRATLRIGGGRNPLDD